MLSSVSLSEIIGLKKICKKRGGRSCCFGQAGDVWKEGFILPLGLVALRLRAHLYTSRCRCLEKVLTGYFSQMVLAPGLFALRKVLAEYCSHVVLSKDFVYPSQLFKPAVANNHEAQHQAKLELSGLVNKVRKLRRIRPSPLSRFCYA